MTHIMIIKVNINNNLEVAEPLRPVDTPRRGRYRAPMEA